MEIVFDHKDGTLFASTKGSPQQATYNLLQSSTQNLE